MIRTIHSIQNIFKDYRTTSSCLAYLHIDETTNAGEQTNSSNLLVAVSKAHSLHIFFYRIHNEDPYSKQSKFIESISQELGSITLENMKFVSNKNRNKICLIGLTRDGKILKSDAIAPNKGILFRELTFERKRPALGMNLIQMKEAVLMNTDENVSFLLAGTNSLSPPTVATICMNDDGEINKSILTEIRGLEETNANITSMSYFDIGLIHSDTRDVLLSLWKTSQISKDDHDFVNTMNMVAMIGCSDGSIYMSLLKMQNCCAEMSVVSTPASKIFRMTMPVQPIISICVSREHQNSKSRILFVGSLFSVAVVDGNIKNTIASHNKSSSYCGNLVYAQLLPHIRKSSNQNENLTMLALTDGGISGTLTYSSDEVKMHSLVDFLPFSMKKDVLYSYAVPIENGSKLVLIAFTFHGCLSVLATQSIDGPYISRSVGNSILKDECITDILHNMESLLERVKLYPIGEIQKKIEDIRKGFELVFEQSIESDSNPAIIHSHEMMKITSIHSYESSSAHGTKPCDLRDLVIICKRSNMPVVQGGSSLSFSKLSPQSQGEVSSFFQKDELCNNLRCNTFVSSMKAFHIDHQKSLGKRDLSEPIFHKNQNLSMGVLASIKLERSIFNQTNSSDENECDSKGCLGISSFSYPVSASANLISASNQSIASNAEGIGHTNAFLSGENARKGILYLYRLCSTLEGFEPDYESIDNLYIMMRSLPFEHPTKFHG